MSVVIDVYFKGLEMKLNHFPTKEELRKDMLEQENIDIQSDTKDRTIKFNFNIGRSHIIQEQWDFKYLEDYRAAKQLKQTVL